MLSLLQQGAAQTPQDAVEKVTDYAQVATEFAIEYAPKLAGALIILVVGWVVARTARGLTGKLMGRAHVDPTLIKFICNLVYMLMMAFVLLMAIGKLGVETASFIAVLGAATFAIGFALQGSLSNFAAGVMIMIFRPFKVGDWVEAGGAAGSIEEVGIFATVFKTGDNKKVIVSNSSVMGGNIVNYSAKETRRVDMVFGIGYGDDIQKAKDVLKRVVDADERVLKDPAVTIAVSGLGDSSVNLICRPWVKTSDFWAVFWHTHEQVKLAFDREGISIPFPQRDVHLHQVA